MMTAATHESNKLRTTRSSSNKTLKVDVSTGQDPDGEYTGKTSSGTSSPPTSLRNNKDLRSPGQRKSPKVASEETAAKPDFITQTDRFGNASTPRSGDAIVKARQVHPTGVKPRLHVGKDGKLHEDDEAEQGALEACTETLLDSFRLMCCCLSPDDRQQPRLVKSQATAEEEFEPEEDLNRPKLLPKLHPDDHGKPCLVLDLDETLVHSSFRAVPGADFVIPVQIEDVVHFVYVAKRPGVDEFLVEMAKHYEIIIYTASLNKYADPLLDLLDPHKTIRTRLFRESCVYYEGNYVKDLSLLDRDLSQSIIIDNSPSSYSFHPENAIDCSSFIDDPSDRELDQIGAFLKGVKDAKDFRGLMPKWRDWPNVNLEGRLKEKLPAE
ncbi:hypothetical protein MPSEU_000806500 [Mayamaea pseudoterrestris]|nr:hypothetical protein MPSEU_000806500 [Mayamaea pseudoterrestris]